MNSKLPAYITKNRLGIFLFQYRIPKQYGINQIFFRISLRTRDNRQALRQARKLAVMMDEILQAYYADPERLKIALEEAKKTFKDAEQLQLALELHKKHTDIAAIQNWSEAEKALNALYIGNEPTPDNNTNPVDNFIKKAELFFSRVDERLSSGNSALSETHFEKLTETIENQGIAHIKSIPLFDAFEEFINEKRRGWKKHGGSEKSYREGFNILGEIVGNIGTVELTKEHTIQYKTVLLRLPVNRNKKKEYKNYTINELMEMDIPDKDQISKGTITKLLGRVSGFLQWLQKHDRAVQNLHTPLQNVIKKDNADHEEKDPYSCSDLKKLFNSKQYKNGLFELSFKFWVPLIGLFTGMRENEICQLYLSDIYQHEITKIWVFDINQDDTINTNKSVKTSEIRLIPIHQKLIEFGFIDFVKSRKKSLKRLFPELPYKNENRYGDKAQRWFNNTYTNKTNCNITNNNTSFHSFRHTLITHLGNVVEMPPHKISNLEGHKAGGTETLGRYMSPADLKDLNHYLQQANFDDCIDFSLIRGWKYHKFNNTKR